MSYESKIIFLFFSILIFLLYLFVFGILHGLKGILNWVLIGLVLLVIVKLVMK